MASAHKLCRKSDGKPILEFDPHRSRLLLSENLQEPMHIQAAHIALIGYRDIIDQVINRVQSDDAALLRITLSGYFAGASVPYRIFSSSETRYDLELLHRRATFEQVCHRLTTLNKSNERGIPFFSTC